jgi:putative two-component system response regulator
MDNWKDTVLVVDADLAVCEHVGELLAAHGIACIFAHAGRAALERLRQDRFAAVLLDLSLPDMSGFAVMREIAERSLDLPIICLTDSPDQVTRARATEAGAMDVLTKPLNIPRVILAVGRALNRLGAETCPGTCIGNVRGVLLESTRALVLTVEAKDPHTRRHSEHVAFYAQRLAEAAELTPAKIEQVRVAAMVHDIGKIAVPDSILTKIGKLTPQEFALIKRHPQVGATIVENISLFRSEALLVRHHHENWDGSGYPQGVAGEQIPMGARLLNIADSMDAMLMHRSYKAAYSVGRMLSELARGAGTQFQPELAHMAIDRCRTHMDELILPDAVAQSMPA